MLNLNRDSEKQRKPFEAIDFMNFIDKPEENPCDTERIDREVFGL